MAKKETNKIAKYATFTLKYYEDEDSPMGNGLRIMNNISSTISNYNSNNAKYGYSPFELIWFSIDPDEVSIDEQNQAFDEIQDTVGNRNLKSKK